MLQKLPLEDYIPDKECEKLKCDDGFANVLVKKSITFTPNN